MFPFTSNLFDAHNNTLAATRPCLPWSSNVIYNWLPIPPITHPSFSSSNDNLYFAHFDQYSLNTECQTMQELFFESTSLGTCCYKTTTNYRVITKSAAENKILRAYRHPCPPVCANWVNWPFRDQHHAATHLDLASIFFSPQNITLAIILP